MEQLKLPEFPQTHAELMSPQEEKELENLLSDCLKGTLDVDELLQHLTDNLQRLETENIQGIVESGTAVQAIHSRMTQTEQQLSDMGQWLNDYNVQLKNMKKFFEHIEDKNNLMEIVTRNQSLLLNEVESFLKRIYLNRTATTTLMKPDFQTDKGLSICIDSAKSLYVLFKSHERMDDDMKQMKSVMEKMTEFNALRDSFSTKLFQHLNDLLAKLAASIEQTYKRAQRSDASWSNHYHATVYEKLNPYLPLMVWLKHLEKEKIQKLIEIYRQAFKPVYRREIKDFFSELKRYFSKDRKEISSMTSIIMKRPLGTINIRELIPPEKMTFDSMFFYCVKTLIPILSKEETFLSEFFQLRSRKQAVRINDRFASSDDSISEDISSSLDIPSDGSDKVSRGKLSSKNKVIENLISDLFEGIFVELKNLQENSGKIEEHYFLDTIVVAEFFESKFSGSIVATALLKSLEKSGTTLFNTYISEQLGIISNSQVSIKRCGILSHIEKFPGFVDSLEYRIVSSRLGRQLVDSSYSLLVSSLFGWLQQLGNGEKEKFRYIVQLENFHHFQKEISTRNVPVLMAFVREAENLYQRNRRALVELLIETKFRKLSVSFQDTDFY